MSKTALIINPWVTDFKLYDEWMHPLGLYILIDQLQKSGYITHYFNCVQRSESKHKKHNTGAFQCTEIEKPDIFRQIKRRYKRYGVSDEKLKEFLLKTPSPDLICVGSMMTYWLPGVSETIECIRSVHPKTPLIAGGIGAKLFGHYLRKHHPDCTIYGNDNFEDHLSSLFKPVKPEEISLIPGLSQLKTAFHAPVLTTLGCPMSCSYCASSLLQPHYYKRDISQVIEEIAFMRERHDVKNFSFYDDALLMDGYNTLYPIYKALEKGISEVRFHTPNGLHARFIDQNTAALMHRMNFQTIRIGYESGNVKHRKQIANKISKDLIAQKIEILQTAGFKKQQIGVYIMGGLESQVPEDFIKEVEFISGLNVMVKPVFISPVPGTSLFDKYANIYPQLLSDPNWHNDVFFITNLPGWTESVLRELELRVRYLNQK
ncbi:Radical SAM domain protein [Chitinispirillum alkaliphilum]|nr:Radical SAM domain protein [Chitinispirillum alkaliphilum]